MKILLVSRSIPLHAGAGGMETASWNLASELSARNQVTVLTTPVPGQMESFAINNLRVETVQGSQPGRYSPKWWIATARYDVSSFDAVISVSAGATAMIWRGRATSPRPRFVFQAHGTAARALSSTARQKEPRWLFKVARLSLWTLIDMRTYRRSQAIVSIGPAVTASLKSPLYRAATRSTPIVEIPNGIAPNNVSGQPRAGMATIGRLVRDKGVDIAIDVAAAGALPLTVAGDGPERNNLEAYAQSTHPGMVTFLGKVDEDTIQQLLARTAVLAFTPRAIDAEGLPMVVLEALASGTNVLTVDSSIWPASVGEQLVLAAAAERESLARALTRALDGGPTQLPPEYGIAAAALAYENLMRLDNEAL